MSWFSVGRYFARRQQPTVDTASQATERIALNIQAHRVSNQAAYQARRASMLQQHIEKAIQVITVLRTHF